ncbi:LPD25 domain-containing protein [Erwinia tasmaniensis]|nr:LPD25 domain-containing protein [Erwinia tasmaniensis]
MNTQKNETEITPVDVLVHWSESGDFPFENKTYSFEEFERAAALAASKTTEFYDKTKITVIFSNGIEYGCGLDLAAHDKKGFRDHCNKMIRYSDTPEGLDYYTRMGLIDCVNFLKSITWPTA